MKWLHKAYIAIRQILSENAGASNGEGNRLRNYWKHIYTCPKKKFPTRLLIINNCGGNKQTILSWLFI